MDRWGDVVLSEFALVFGGGTCSPRAKTSVTGKGGSLRYGRQGYVQASLDGEFGHCMHFHRWPFFMLGSREGHGNYQLPCSQRGPLMISVSPGHAVK